MWFSGWSTLVRTLVVGIAAYTALVLLLRISGKRTLSKFNAFDFVVTVALGSTLASILTSGDVALAQGILAFSLLVGLQFAMSLLVTRWPAARRLVTSEPRLVVYRGTFLRDALRAERLHEADVLAAVRAAGCASLEEAEAVVLETDGSVAVVTTRASSPADALRTVRGAPRDTDPDREVR